ncbi:MAG: ribosome maturation factor RimP [Candidatus Borkfalkiaceae bacterium]|nr:ribosome maturation factor RimP [Clostridia bacterium]MDY6224026.1 ribosome maturation factor RimP [Christensenellaceae bacterium]
MKCKPVEEIKTFLEPYVTALGAEIYDVSFKNGKNPALTVFIDKEDGVDLDLCEAVHHAIDDPLDALDPTFGEPYTLNVSSPGIDRPLKTDKDFSRAVGKKVEIKLFAPHKGKKSFEAVLTAFDEHSVTLNTGKEEEKFERSKIARINEAIDFD